jgi:GNAT superfamily N-acetyltransferase
MPVSAGKITYRRLREGDENVLADLEHTAMLADESTVVLAAFDGEHAVGSAIAHVLPHRHGNPKQLLIYDVGVDESHRRRGVARGLLEWLAAYARAHGVGEGWVLTEPDNDASNALYASAGGVRSEVVMWDFEFADD